MASNHYHFESRLRNGIDISEFEVSFAKHFTNVLQETSTVLNRVTKLFIKHLFSGSAHWVLSWPVRKDWWLTAFVKPWTQTMWQIEVIFQPWTKTEREEQDAKTVSGRGVNALRWQSVKLQLTPF